MIKRGILFCCVLLILSIFVYAQVATHETLPVNTLQPKSGDTIQVDANLLNVGGTTVTGNIYKGIQWSDGTETWRLGTYIDDIPRTVYVYLTKGTGTGYQNLAVGSIIAQAPLSIFRGALQIERPTTAESDIKQDIDSNSLTISADNINGFLPGLVWNTRNNNFAKPKAGIWVETTSSSSTMKLGTSNSFSTGITNTGLAINPSGDVEVETLCLSGDCKSTWPVTSSGIETDPKIAAVTTDKLCRGTGTQITCDQDPTQAASPPTILKCPNTCTVEPGETCNVFNRGAQGISPDCTGQREVELTPCTCPAS